MSRIPRAVAVLALASASAFTMLARGQAPSRFNETLVSAFTYRNVGPFRMGARTSDIAVPASPAKDHLYTFYVSFWTGGVWKTTNNGTTFEPVFDAQSKLTIGDVDGRAVERRTSSGSAPATRSRRAARTRATASTSPPTPARRGRTWGSRTRTTSRASRSTRRTRTSCTSPRWAICTPTNAERGVFRTIDGGATWEKVLYVEREGRRHRSRDEPEEPGGAVCGDLRQGAAAVADGQRRARQRHLQDDGRRARRGRSSAAGCRAGAIGRIGLDIYLGESGDPVRRDRERESAHGRRQRGRGGGLPGVDRSSAARCIARQNGGQTWTKMNADDYNVSPKGPYYFSQIRVDPNNDQNIFVTQDGFRHSLDGGKTWNAPRVFPRMFGDVRTLWIDPENPDRMIAGQRRRHRDLVRRRAHERSLREHAGRRDLRDRRRHGGSVQPLRRAAGSRALEGAVERAAGPRRPCRTGSRSATATASSRSRRSDGQPLALHDARVRSAHARSIRSSGYRDEHHAAARRPGSRRIGSCGRRRSTSRRTTARSIYAGAQMLLRSTDRGDHWTEISPDLSTNPTDKILPRVGGRRARRHSVVRDLVDLGVADDARA